MNVHRRRVLQSSGIALSLLAGCSIRYEDEEGEATPADTQTTLPQTETPTEEEPEETTQEEEEIGSNPRLGVEVTKVDKEDDFFIVHFKAQNKTDVVIWGSKLWLRIHVDADTPYHYHSAWIYSIPANSTREYTVPLFTNEDEVFYGVGDIENVEITREPSPWENIWADAVYPLKLQSKMPIDTPNGTFEQIDTYATFGSVTDQGVVLTADPDIDLQNAKELEIERQDSIAPDLRNLGDPEAYEPVKDWDVEDGQLRIRPKNPAYWEIFARFKATTLTEERTFVVAPQWPLVTIEDVDLTVQETDDGVSITEITVTVQATEGWTHEEFATAKVPVVNADLVVADLTEVSDIDTQPSKPAVRYARVNMADGSPLIEPITGEARVGKSATYTVNSGIDLEIPIEEKPVSVMLQSGATILDSIETEPVTSYL